MKATTIPVDIGTIKYRGLFNYEELLRLIYTSLEEDQFLMHEAKYTHKIPDPRGAEQELSVRGWRLVTGYVRYDVKVDIKAWDLKEVEVVKEHDKRHMTQGRVRIIIKGTMTLDYQGKFKGSTFMEGLRSFYQTYIVKQDIENYHWDELYYRLYKLHRMVKEHLGMESATNAYEGVW